MIFHMTVKATLNVSAVYFQLSAHFTDGIEFTDHLATAKCDNTFLEAIVAWFH